MFWPFDKTIRYSQEWTLFHRDSDGLPIVCLVDVGISKNLGLFSKLTLLEFCLEYSKIADTGMPTPEATSAFAELDQQLESFFLSSKAYLFARTTGVGARTFYIFSPAPEKACAVMRKASEEQDLNRLRLTIHTPEEIPEIVATLAPTPYELQSAKDMIAIERLVKAGDPLTVERPIEHLAVFTLSADATKFVKWTRDNAFEPIEQGGELKQQGYKVRFSHQLAPRPDYLLPITRTVLEAVINNNGIYQGWVTALVNLKETDTVAQSEL